LQVKRKMLKWCNILLISEFYQFQARSIANNSCTDKSTADLPEQCILKCVQTLYDNKFCTICENNSNFSVNFLKKETLDEQLKLKWCSVCETGQWQINSTNYELQRRELHRRKPHKHIRKDFNASGINWCIDVFNLYEFNATKSLNRKKRFINRGFGFGPHSPSRPTDHSEAYILMGMIIFGTFMLCVLVNSCTDKSTADLPEQCILKCVQTLYDNKFCTICENNSNFSVDFPKKDTLDEQLKLKWCSVCETGQWHMKSTHYELQKYQANRHNPHSHTGNVANALEISWCIYVLKLYEFNVAKELFRTKRLSFNQGTKRFSFNPGIGGFYSRPQKPSRRVVYSETFILVGKILTGILLLCALLYLCKIFSKRIGTPGNYQINS
ncbi:hypothetical protein Bhyg_15497, partial [Pseudolycoriella hygida]